MPFTPVARNSRLELFPVMIVFMMEGLAIGVDAREKTSSIKSLRTQKSLRRAVHRPGIPEKVSAESQAVLISISNLFFVGPGVSPAWAERFGS